MGFFNITPENSEGLMYHLVYRKGLCGGLNWLIHCANGCKVAGSIPDVVVIFH